MSRAHQFAGRMLEQASGTYALEAARRLFQRRPDLATGLGSHAIPLWQEVFASHIKDLSVALSEGRPIDFVRRVAWSKIAFAARNMPREFLSEGLSELRGMFATELPLTARGSVDEYLSRAVGTVSSAPSDLGERLRTDTRNGKLCGKYMLNLLEGDRRAASKLVLDAVARAEITVHEAYLDICLAAQREIGSMWHMNEIGIAEEHFVSATTLIIMSQLLGQAQFGKDLGKTVLAATASGELHDIGLRCAADFLAIDGWRTIYLGSDIPPADLATGVLDFSPDVIVISATLSSHRRDVRLAIDSIRTALELAERPRVPVIVGGHAFDDGAETWNTVGADASAASPSDLLRVARELTNLPPT